MDHSSQSFPSNCPSNVNPKSDSRLKGTPEIELLNRAIQNDPIAMAQVATNYYLGENGFPSDDDLAFFWSKKMSETYPDYDFAWEMLGRCYKFGVGTEKSISKALEAYTKCVNLGGTYLLYTLANLYYFNMPDPEKGKCVPLLEEAVANQDKQAEALLGYIYLTKEFQTRNQQKGLELLIQSAEHGDPEGARILAEAYLHQVCGSEDIVPYNVNKASQYFAIAVDNGENSPKALYYAGPAYFYGEGVPKSMEKARKCIEALIDAYVPEEKVFDLLGCMCFEGIGGPIDFELGEKALRRAIESDDKDVSLEAMNNLGMYFYTLSNRLPEAIQLFQSAASQGNANAQVNLGKAYYEGKGVPQDLEKAEHYFQLAAKQGNTTAQENLEVLQSEKNTANTPQNSGCAGCLLWTGGAMVVFVAILYILKAFGTFG